MVVLLLLCLSQDKCLDRVSCAGEGSGLELGACKKCCAKVCLRLSGWAEEVVRVREARAFGRWGARVEAREGGGWQHEMIVRH